MCCLAHGGHSQCKGADTKGGDAMGIMVGREWCLYLVTVYVFAYELYLYLIMNCVCVCL